MTQVDRAPSRYRRWSVAAWLLVAALALCFLMKNRGELPAAWAALHGADPRWLALGTIVTLVGVVNLGMLHAAAQRVAGLDPAPLDLVRTSAAANALNDIAKTNGVAGATVFLRRAAEHGDANAPTVAAYLLATVSIDMSVAATLLVAVPLLSFEGHLSTLISTAVVIYFVMFSVKLALIAAAFHSRAAVREMFSIPGRILARVRRCPSRAFDESTADEMFDATVLVRRNLRNAGRVAGHSLVARLIGIVSLWASLRAVGAHVDLVVPVVAFAVAMLFSNVSFMPGGVGMVELTLGSVLVAFGVRSPAAAAAVLIWRLFELWLPLAFGAWCLRSRNRRGLGCVPSDVRADVIDDRPVVNQHLIEGAIS